jgi:1,2-phenylacetyl-CoA epoxidase PaaB subunit
MAVWDVFGKRTAGDDWTLVGGITAPDVEMALVLARETHFRHKEGVAYAVQRRGDRELHPGSYDPELLGGLTDRSYRRQEAYTGVGAKHKRVSKLMADRGLIIDRPRPPAGRRPPGVGERVHPSTVQAEARDIREVSPEEIASQGTAG